MLFHGGQPVRQNAPPGLSRPRSRREGGRPRVWHDHDLASAAELQLALIRAWHLPELLVTLLDDSQQDNPRVRTIQLAADFARHLAHGWEDPALPDDLAALEALLHLSREPLLHRLGVPEDMRARFLPPPAAEPTAAPTA